MLTEEEQRQRAIAASQLYGQPLQQKVEKRVFQPGIALLSGFILTLPIILADGMFNLYTKVPYVSVGDVKIASMLVIAALGLVTLTLLTTLKYIHQRLDAAYSYGSSTFWLGSAVVIGCGFLLYRFLEGPGTQPLMEIVTRWGVYAGALIVISVVWLFVIASFFYWGEVRQSKRS